MAAPSPPDDRPVLVLGGSGFLGRRVVEALLAADEPVRVGVRDADRAHDLFGGRAGIRRADVTDEASLRAAADGARAIVNAVSLYVESGGTSFHDIHVAGAANVAAIAAEGRLRLVHMSGIGADPHARNAYVRARGRGEEAVRQADPDAIVLRSAAMVGPDDALLTTIVDLVKRMKVIPLFGRGGTRMQPVHVEDVAAAIAALVRQGGPAVSEIGGPRVLTYRQLVEEAARRCGTRPALVPMPFAAWRGLAMAGRILPRSPIDAGQVALMERDTVAAPDRDLRNALPLPARDLATVLEILCP